MLDCARSMILGKKVNIKLWSEAVKTAAYILNRVITRSTETKSPFEKCFGYAPDIKHMRIFGSTAYLNVPIPQRNKFTTRSRKMMLVGYDEESCNYRLWDKETQRIKISSDVNFYENDDVILDMQVENWMTIKFGDDDEIDKSEPHVECNIKQISDPSENRSDEVVQEDQVHMDLPLNTITQADAPRYLRNRDTLKAPDRFGVPLALLADAGPDTYDEAMSSKIKNGIPL